MIRTLSGASQSRNNSAGVSVLKPSAMNPPFSRSASRTTTAPAPPGLS